MFLRDLLNALLSNANWETIFRKVVQELQLWETDRSSTSQAKLDKPLVRMLSELEIEAQTPRLEQHAFAPLQYITGLVELQCASPCQFRLAPRQSTLTHLFGTGKRSCWLCKPTSDTDNVLPEMSKPPIFEESWVALVDT